MQISGDGRPFMGPNLHVTPTGSFTQFHQVGHGTVDSSHFCVSGFNEVVMIRRLTERHKLHAADLLRGDRDREGSSSSFGVLYNLPHADTLVSFFYPNRRSLSVLTAVCPYRPRMTNLLGGPLMLQSKYVGKWGTYYSLVL
jgi:hypothetical protein